MSRERNEEGAWVVKKAEMESNVFESGLSKSV